MLEPVQRKSWVAPVVPPPPNLLDPWSRPPFWAGRSPPDRRLERWERDRRSLDELAEVRRELAMSGHQAGTDAWKRAHVLMNRLELELGLTPTTIESPTWYTGGRAHGGGGIDESDQPTYKPVCDAETA